MNKEIEEAKIMCEEETLLTFSMAMDQEITTQAKRLNDQLGEPSVEKISELLKKGLAYDIVSDYVKRAF